MNKPFPLRRVECVLRQFGFTPAPSGSKAFCLWKDTQGRHCRLMGGRPNVPYSNLYTLAQFLDRQGVCSAATFLTTVKGRSL